MSVPPNKVGRIVDDVFSRPEYNGNARSSLWEDFLAWVWRYLQRLINGLNASPHAAAVVKYTLFALAAIVVIAIAVKLIQHYRATRNLGEVRFSADTVADLWKEAEHAAARGEHTRAAHLLYAALIRMLVLRNAVRFHASKTTGDYVRELRRKGGPIVASFTDFVRVYEVVIYRDGTCDAERYATLRALADPVVHSRLAAA